MNSKYQHNVTNEFNQILTDVASHYSARILFCTHFVLHTLLLLYETRPLSIKSVVAGTETSTSTVGHLVVLGRRHRARRNY